MRLCKGMQCNGEKEKKRERERERKEKESKKKKVMISFRLAGADGVTFVKAGFAIGRDVE